MEGAATWKGSTNDKIPFQLPVFHFGLIEPFLRTQRGAMVIDSMLDGFSLCRLAREVWHHVRQWVDEKDPLQMHLWTKHSGSRLK